MNGLDRTEVGVFDCPPDVVDRLLWQDAQQIMHRHAADPRRPTCGWCGRAWPCPPRRLAERADVASRSPWREGWTTRNDMSDLRLLPGRHHAGRNRRRYDPD